MSRNEPLPEQSPLPTAPASTGSRFGSLRAGILVVLTMLLPAVALLGPNQLYEWFSPAVAQQMPQLDPATGPSSTTAQLHNVEHPPVSASHLTPRLTEPKYKATAQLPLALPPESTQFTRHAQPVEAQPTIAQPAAEYRLRESASESHDRMQQIQGRLQLLGARYMVLETWGDVAPSYRFYCRMPHRQGGHSEHESICGDPVEAMQRVLGEVEQVMARR